MPNELYVPECCVMKNSKSDSWILQAGVAGNPYPQDKIRYSVEFSTVHLFTCCPGLHFINFEIAAVHFIPDVTTVAI